MALPVTAPRNSGSISLLLLCLTAGAVHSPLQKNENLTLSIFVRIPGWGLEPWIDC